MKRHLPLAVALLLCLSLPSFAQEGGSASELAIRQVVQLYIDGVRNNDAESLRKSLHPKGKWFFPSYTQDLKEVKQESVVENIKSNLKKGIGADKGASRIASIDVTNDAAAVKVEFDRPDAYLAGNKGDTSAQSPGVRQTDYLSLLRLAGGWKIVGKVSTLEKLPGARQSASK